MKILYHHRIASKDGQYVHLEEIVKAFRKLGHEVILVGPLSVENENFGTDGGIVSSLKKHLPGFLYELLEFSYNIIAFIRLVVAILKHRPDFIYERYNLFLPAGIWAKKLFKLPFVLEVNAPIFDERSKYDQIKLPRLASWTERYCWKNADIVLPVTQVLANRILKEGVRPDKVFVIPNGIDPDTFSRVPDKDTAKKKIGLDGKLILGFVGFIREWHGLDRVIDIISSHNNPNIYFLVIGDGPARVDLEKKADLLGVKDKIKITGLVERSDISDYIAAFDIALQPDVVEYASPLKLFEYLVLGHAIVAPDTDNIKEVLDHNVNAILFDVNEKDSFRQSIEMLCNDEALRKRIGNNAKSLIEEKKYKWLDNASKILALVNQYQGRS